MSKRLMVTFPTSSSATLRWPERKLNPIKSGVGVSFIMAHRKVRETGEGVAKFGQEKPVYK